MNIIIQKLKPFVPKLILIALMEVITAVSTLVLPYLMSMIVDDGIAVADMNKIIFYSVLMFTVALIGVVLAIITAKISSDVGMNFTASLQKVLFDKVNSLTFEEYSSIGTASFLTRQTDDVSMLGDVATSLVYFAVHIPVMFIGGGIMAFMSDWSLALIITAVIPVILLYVYPISKKVGKLWDKSDKMMDKQNAVVRERLKGIRVIRAFDREGYEHGRIKDATVEMSKAIVNANVLSGIISPAASFLLNMATVAAIYVGTVRMQNSAAISAGGIVAVIQYISVMAGAVISASWMLVWIPHIQVALKRIGEVFAFKEMEQGSLSGVKLKGDIKMSNVTFAYEKKPVLKNINIDISEGETVGIIGGTGSGKTTLLKLLMGFYSSYDGKISLGGEDYKSLSQADVRDNISVALQKSMIFEDTVKENIKMSNSSATDEEIKAAAEIAQIDDFISSQKEGYDYPLSGQGTNISGGQKQRINIARTILKDASVYIFDDSFSALDFLTESKLRKALNKKLEGKTQIIITQRIATAMRCDKVYVLDKGELVGAGVHKELMRSCEIYREIYHSQLGGDLNENECE